MTQKTKPVDYIEAYTDWLLSELKRQGVSLVVVGEESLKIKGKMTAEQKENIRLWKRQLIDALSPKCGMCALPMNLIENGQTWFCPIGCQSREAK